MTARAAQSGLAAMLAAGFLWAAAVAPARAAPPVAADSSAGVTGARRDPAILWTFDSGG